MNTETKPTANPRIEEIIALIYQLEVGNLEARGTPSERDDDLDRIITRLNMLAARYSTRYISYDKTEQPSVAQDITEHKQAEETHLFETEQHARQVAEIMRIANIALTKTLNLETVLETLLDCLSGLVPYDSANVMLLEAKSEVLRVKIHTIRGYEKWTDPNLIHHHCFDVNSNSTLHAILTNQKSMSIPDTHQAPDWEHNAATAYIRNWLGVPLIAGGEVIGLYSMDKSEPGFFTETHCQLAEALATQASIAIQNARLYTQAQQEIVERQYAEMALRESEHFNKAIISSVGEGVIVYDTEFCYQVWNNSMEKLTGMPADEVLGKNAFDLFPHLREQGIDLLLQRALRGETVRSPDTPFYIPSTGRSGWFAGMYSPHVNVDGEIIGVVATIRDITKRKQVEEELKKYRDHLEELVEDRTAELITANQRLQQEIIERKRAEKALQQSEERYRKLFELAPKPIITGNMKGIVTSCNAATLNLIGYTEDELIGKHFSKLPFIRMKDIPRYLRILSALVRGRVPEPFEGAYYRGDGTVAWCNVHMALFEEDDGKKSIQAVFTDITERKQTEEALRESEEKLRSTIASMDDSIFVLDKSGKFLDYYQPQNINALYTPPELFLGKSFKKVLPPHVVKLFETAIETIVETDRVQQFDYPLKVAGKELWFSAKVSMRKDNSGRFAGVTVVVRDITGRKQVEEQLRLQATALEAAANGIVITNREGTIIWVNPAFTQLTGYTAEEAVSQTPRVLKSGKHDQVFYQDLWQTILAGQVWHGEIINCRKDGRLYTEETTITPVCDEHGQASHFVAIKQDITRRKQMEEILHESERRYTLATHAGQVGVWDWNLETGEVYIDPNLKAILGYTDHEIRNHLDDWRRLIHPDDVERVLAEAESYLAGVIPQYEVERRMLHKNGGIHWFLARGTAVWDADGKPYRLMGTDTDITERRVAEEKVRYMAMHDALTGLPNRASFTTCLEYAIEQARQREGYLFALLFLDLDRFKLVNDSLGHLVGDRLLTAIARRLEACVRPGDVVARLGGDEFTVLLNDLRSVDEARQVADRIQNELALPINLNGHTVFTAVSIGITTSVREYEHPDELLRDADTAMYQAKARGRARHEMFDTDHRIKTVARLRLETELRQAVERQEFMVYYRPIVSLTSGRITGIEALLRWQHPQRGLITPNEFISLAEETGMIVPLGEWVLRTACTQTRVWHVAGYEPLRLAVNVSARQFQDQNLPDLIEDVLTETELEARSLELEITERISGQDGDVYIETLHKLRALGLQISIDDFGLGSSLNCLKRLPLDALKIDHSFIEDMGSDGDGATIITAVIAMAHSLNLKVIAEGVETEEHLAFLRSQQCDEIQGHLFSESVPAETLTKMLQAGHSLSPLL